MTLEIFTTDLKTGKPIRIATGTEKTAAAAQASLDGFAQQTRSKIFAIFAGKKMEPSSK